MLKKNVKMIWTVQLLRKDKNNSHGKAPVIIYLFQSRKWFHSLGLVLDEHSCMPVPFLSDKSQFVISDNLIITPN